jgi:hypothetical protein
MRRLFSDVRVFAGHQAVQAITINPQHEQFVTRAAPPLG